MSALAHSLKCSPKDNPLLSLIIVQMVGSKFEKLEVESLTFLFKKLIQSICKRCHTKSIGLKKFGI